MRLGEKGDYITSTRNNIPGNQYFFLENMKKYERTGLSKKERCYLCSFERNALHKLKKKSSEFFF